jgi:hypothetical protein
MPSNFDRLRKYSDTITGSLILRLEKDFLRIDILTALLKIREIYSYQGSLRL